jgi:hypothetical protein
MEGNVFSNFRNKSSHNFVFCNQLPTSIFFALGDLRAKPAEVT